MRLQGELIDTSTANIVQRANDVISAYGADYGDFSYTVGGVLAHSLTNSANCISGVKVINKQFPSGGPEQLATTRTFGATLQATYDVSEDNIVSWQESVSVQGNGGPLVVLVHTILYGIAYDVLSPNTAIYYTQSGMATGFNDYPVPPGPIAPVGELGYLRRITKTSGTQQGTGIKYFTTRWSYQMFSGPSVFYGDTPTSK